MNTAPARAVAAIVALVLYLGLCLAVALAQRRRRQVAAHALSALTPGMSGSRPVLVAFASQTGNAEQLAWQTANALHTAGLTARLLPFAQLDATVLAEFERALLIVSTYGEGDPPDAASLFAGHVMTEQVALPQLHYAVLALGDRDYKNYCGFGQALDRWLSAHGAHALFPRIEVNNSDPAALEQWRHHLSHLAGTDDLLDWQAPSYDVWILHARHHLNPGSAGGPIFHVELVPPSGVPLPAWQSGDLFQVRVPSDPQCPREYSVASLPANQGVHLLIRQQKHDDGTLGAASGWLTMEAPIGSAVSARLRPHSNFRLGDNIARDLILVGNGTGLGGLRGHLEARVAAARSASHPPRNWLIFGERNAAYDDYYRDELDAWHAAGLLTKLDRVYSRDRSAQCYVQHRLLAASAEVRAWVEAGAAIYVCGSLEGMASEVQAALISILGNSSVESLIKAGRYRRDVY